MSQEKSCHYCLGGTKPWYVWKRAYSEWGTAPEQIPGLLNNVGGRRHRLCRECHKALLALKRTVGK